MGRAGAPLRSASSGRATPPAGFLCRRASPGCPRFAQVASGAIHTGTVADAGDLLMCGYGGHGRLGLGDEDIRRWWRGRCLTARRC